MASRESGGGAGRSSQPALSPRPQAEDRIVEVLDASPADETSLAWLEGWRLQAASGVRAGEEPRSRQEVLVRVLEGGRPGMFRAVGDTGPELHRAVRQALAVARAAAPVPGFPHLPNDPSPTPRLEGLWDEEVATLGQAAATELLDGLLEDGESARLDWSVDRVMVASSRGLRRAAEVTGVRLHVRCGRGPLAGTAAAAARSLAELRPAEVVAVARERRAEGALAAPPAAGCPLVLSPEAVAALLDVVVRRAFTAIAYLSDESLLREYLGVQVFDRAVRLVDDGLATPGLPFPFDVEGTVKRPVELIVAGAPRTPALDQLHAAQLGLAATPHACAGDDARPEHLHLDGGELSAAEVLACAEDGVWVGELVRLECFDPRRLQVRAVARGVRRVRAGRLAEPLPELVWQASLLHELGQVRGIGRDRRVLPDREGTLGAITAPAMVLAEAVGLGPA